MIHGRKLEVLNQGLHQLEGIGAQAASAVISTSTVIYASFSLIELFGLPTTTILATTTLMDPMALNVAVVSKWLVGP